MIKALRLKRCSSAPVDRKISKFGLTAVKADTQPELAKAEPPQEYIDMFSSDIMSDPVFTADGHTYERAGITRWLGENKTSPNFQRNLFVR